MKGRNSCWLAPAAFVLDRLTQLLAQKALAPGVRTDALPGLFRFVLVKNTGAAFNILSGRIGFLSIISLLFVIGVIWYMIVKKPQNRLFCIALMLLFSGAVGNMADRIFRGFVVDFIKTVFIEFPVFNIADIAITCGAILLIIYLLFFEGRKE